MKKRIIAFVLAAVMVFALCACGTESDVGTGEKALVKVTIPSHVSWPYQENWKVWEYIREGTGMDLEVTSLPGSDAATKLSLMFSSPELLPDVMAFTYKPESDKYVPQGAVIALDDMTEQMPNYNAWVDSLTDEQYENIVNVRKSYDGKVYYTPVTGREASENVRSWLYRKDIFEKHNLEVPTTFDELYEVSKELKELYPDSYPFCMRSGMSNIDMTGASWKPYWTTGVYYDFDNEEWNYGAREDIMLDVLNFYKKMVDEKLLMPNFITIDTTSWQELVSTNRGFILPEFQTRIDFFNSMTKREGIEFNLQVMKPPVANAETGVAKVNRYNIDPTGYVICNTFKEEGIKNAARFLDWFYTDEAMELVSWGKEGETFEVVDGNKQYILGEEGGQVQTLYGFSTYGAFLRMDPEAVAATESESLAATRDVAMEALLPYANPVINLAFNDEEAKKRTELASAINSYSAEMVTKFILGQEPLSKFDEFKSELNKMGVDELLKVYESAYSRVKK